MTHARTEIRDALVTRLTGLPTTGPRVYPGRTRSLAEGHEPTLLIYATSEQSARAIEGNPSKQNRATLQRKLSKSASASTRVAGLTPAPALTTANESVSRANSNSCNGRSRPRMKPCACSTTGS